MLCCVFWLVSPKCLSGKFLRCVNVSALVSTWMVRYAISSNYSKMLNSAQMNYTTIDKELLCVIATLQKSTLCCLVLNYMSTLITKTFSILVTPYSVNYVGSPMLMNMDQNCIV